MKINTKRKSILGDFGGVPMVFPPSTIQFGRRDAEFYQSVLQKEPSPGF